MHKKNTPQPNQTELGSVENNHARRKTKAEEDHIPVAVDVVLKPVAKEQQENMNKTRIDKHRLGKMAEEHRKLEWYAIIGKEVDFEIQYEQERRTIQRQMQNNISQAPTDPLQFPAWADKTLLKILEDMKSESKKTFKKEWMTE